MSFYLHVSECPGMNPVKLIVRKVCEDEELEALEDSDVETADGGSGHVEVSEGGKVPQSPLRNVLDVAAVDLEQLQFAKSDNPEKIQLKNFDLEQYKLKIIKLILNKSKLVLVIM